MFINKNKKLNVARFERASLKLYTSLCPTKAEKERVTHPQYSQSPRGALNRCHNSPSIYLSILINVIIFKKCLVSLF